VIADSIRFNKSLNTLQLNFNPLEIRGGAMIAAAIAANKSISRFGITSIDSAPSVGADSNMRRGVCVCVFVCVCVCVCVC
jgi:hypothetical protein